MRPLTGFIFIALLLLGRGELQLAILGGRKVRRSELQLISVSTDSSSTCFCNGTVLSKFQSLTIKHCLSNDRSNHTRCIGLLDDHFDNGSDRQLSYSSARPSTSTGKAMYQLLVFLGVLVLRYYWLRQYF